MSQTIEKSNLDNIRVVLVRTFHSGNIGSTARAMKTMGLTNLILVSPKDFQLDQALQMAMSADDVVTNAKHVDSLYEAVSNCTVVTASTARTRGYDLPMQNPEQAAQLLCRHSSQQNVALVFGPERMGLSNEDLLILQLMSLKKSETCRVSRIPNVFINILKKHCVMLVLFLKSIQVM